MAKRARKKGPARGGNARTKRPRKVGGTKRPVPSPVPARHKKKKPRAPAAPPKHRYRLAVKTRVQLREGIELLRKHVRGYESRDGYHLSAIDTLDAKQRRRIINRAAKLRELTTSPHDTVKARTKKERKNLHQFTGQRIRGAKHYIVHKPADNFEVRLVDGNVEIAGKFKGGVKSTSRFFLFPRRPRYPKELVAMARKLLKEMPQGFYTVLTAAHGDTGEPFERDKLIDRLNEYLAAYEVDSEGKPTGFSEALIGFRYMSTTLKGAVTQRAQIDARRQKQRDYNRRIRAQAEIAERARLKKRRKARKPK